jgi:hypothetical protein
MLASLLAKPPMSSPLELAAVARQAMLVLVVLVVIHLATAALAATTPRALLLRAFRMLRVGPALMGKLAAEAEAAAVQAAWP